MINFRVDLEQEQDGRWIAEIPELPGVMVYGKTQGEAGSRVQALALRVVADGLETDESHSELMTISFSAA